MAKRSILGVDIGHDNLKLALVKNGMVEKVIVEPMPDNMLIDGKVVSTEAMGQFIGRVVKKNRLKGYRGALVLNEETAIIRTIQMPIMTESQLLYNLPYEFKDYITGNIDDFIFDYAMLSQPEEETEKKKEEPKAEVLEEEQHPAENEQENTMEVLGVAIPKSERDHIRYTFRKSGIKLVEAAPSICGLAAITRRLQQMYPDKEYCFLDIGYESIRMHIFKGDEFKVTRALERGLSSLVNIIAEEYDVDVHLAHTYMLTNYDQCLEHWSCLQEYSAISTEVMRVVHFYQFSNPDSNLEEIWLCGGGAAIDGLYQTISDNNEVIIRRADSLIQDISGNAENCNLAIAAIGVALQ